MGAGPSLVTISSSARPSGSSRNSVVLPTTVAASEMMPDHALRDTLRQLQLSPEIIDESVTALYAHAQDPVEHPVDEDLARLCTSEFTRGALHALALYLAAASALDSPRAVARTPHVPVLSVASTTSHVSGSVVGLNTTGYDGGENNDPMRSSESLLVEGGDGVQPTESVTGKLTTMWNRLRRTRSMPSGDQAIATAAISARVNCLAITPVELDEHDNSDNIEASSPVATAGGHKKRNMKVLPPPKLKVNVKGTQGSGRRPSLMGGLGLGSPRSTRGGDAVPPRRAPVRTGHWKLGHEIGKGSFGAVHIGLNEDSGDLIAVKVLSLQNAETAEPLYREIELMRQLTHPNIVCYLGAEVNDGEKTISIFQEWVPGSVTTLLVNFGPFSDRRIAGYTRQILHGLFYLHKERVIHRDIKGGNILIDDRGVVKLCDFGASKMLDTESVTGMGEHTRVGSPLFMAPEILLRQEYGPQVDIWSLGGAVLEMATGQPPWHTLNLRTPVALINWVKRTEGPPPLPDGLSPLLTKFLLRCFERDPKKRATAKQLLSDPFVANRQGDLPISKASSPASDDDSVSDIENLSRSAAIERIRRASLSDFASRPNSASNSNASNNSNPSSAEAGSSATPRSPRASGRQMQGSGRLGSSRQSIGGNGIAVPPGQTPRTGQSESHNQGSSSGSMFPTGLSRPSPLDVLYPLASGDGVVGDMGRAGDRRTSPRASPRLDAGQHSSSSFAGEHSSAASRPARPLSLQHGRGNAVEIAPSLEIVTGCPEPSTSVAGASASRMTTPTRRQSGGGSRAGSASPNPFGGRRRSLDSQSPRNSNSAAAVAASSSRSSAVVGPGEQTPERAGSGGSIGVKGGGVGRGRGRAEVRDNEDTMVMAPGRGKTEASGLEAEGSGSGCRSTGISTEGSRRRSRHDNTEEKRKVGDDYSGEAEAIVAAGVATSGPRSGSSPLTGGVLLERESVKVKPRSGRGERPSAGGDAGDVASECAGAAAAATDWR